MEEGMFMIRLTGIIELAVPISKFHHELCGYFTFG
jgi:hypothetical protein